MEDKKTWIKFVPKKEKPWKTDCFFGVARDEPHGHASISGAKILDGKFVDGEFYYFRDIDRKVLINKDEDGKNLL